MDNDYHLNYNNLDVDAVAKLQVQVDADATAKGLLNFEGLLDMRLDNRQDYYSKGALHMRTFPSAKDFRYYPIRVSADEPGPLDASNWVADLPLEPMSAAELEAMNLDGLFTYPIQMKPDQEPDPK